MRHARSLLRPLHATMAIAAVVAVLVSVGGCPSTGGAECTDDPQCDGGEVCGRDQMCAPASTVREVTTTWTVRGEAASMTTCASHPNLFISYIGRDFGDTLGFAPVPCHIGQFKIDKLPDRFTQVELGIEGGASRVRSIGSTNAVTIDLP